MITNGGETSLWEEIPMSAIQSKDKVYMVSYVRWEPVEESAGFHDITWNWYQGTQRVHRCESTHLKLEKTPYRLWCRTQAAGLGLGHFRVEMLIDGVPMASNEFDVVNVAPAKDSTVTYRIDSAKAGVGEKGPFLAHCTNALDVSREIGFPPEAAAAGLREGSVVLILVLTPAGSLKDVKILSASDKLFEPAAIRAATRLKCNGEGLVAETPLRWELTYKAH